MSSNQTINILSLILLILGIVFDVMLTIFLFVTWKTRTKKTKVKSDKNMNNKSDATKPTVASSYNKQSIFDLWSLIE